MTDRRLTNSRRRPPPALTALVARRPGPVAAMGIAMLAACQFDSTGFGSSGPASPYASSTAATSDETSSASSTEDATAGSPPAPGGSESTTSTSGDPADSDPAGDDTGTDTGTSTGACTPQTWYPDADGDGFGGPGPEVMACEAPADHVANADDCDDTNAAINPEALESCNDLDDDCDEITDEGSAINESCRDCEFVVAADGTRVFARCEGRTARDMALARCREDFGPDAELARIDNDLDQQELLARIGNDDHWIGLDDLADEGTWRWHDGSLAYQDGAAVGYDGWRPGQPMSDNEERCGELDPNGWADANCSQSQLRICEHAP